MLTVRLANALTMLVACLTLGAGKGASQEYPQALLVVSTFSEISLAATRAVDQHAAGPSSTLYWNASFSDNHFALKGEFNSEIARAIDLSGYVWPDVLGNLRISYSGVVVTADEGRILASGSAFWRFDPEIDSHNELNIDLVTRFGDNTEWTWFDGAEIAVGGAIGAAGAVGATTVATLGPGILASPWAAAAGFLGGSAAAITISEVFVGTADSEEPPPTPTEPPTRPLPPAPDADIPIGGGQMIVVVSSDGSLFGATPSADYILTGTYDLAGGSASGAVEMTQ